MEKTSGGLGTGEYSLRFNKLANVPSDEIPEALVGTNDTTGIPGTANAYINDMQFNTEITLWVKSGTDFEFVKIDKDGNPFGLGDAEFQLYSCAHVHDANCGGLSDPTQCDHNHFELASDASETGGCWVVSGPTVLTEITDADGKILFEKLYSGDYILAETRTLPGYQLPVGQWLVQVDAVTGIIKITARGETPPAFMDDGSGVLKLPNYPTITFPPTGGTGTFIFTITGIVLIGLAVMLIIVARRQKGVCVRL